MCRTPKDQLKIYITERPKQDVFSAAAATKNTKEVEQFAGKDIIIAVKVVLLGRLILSEVRPCRIRAMVATKSSATREEGTSTIQSLFRRTN
jgi:uncharacterized membrane protein